MTDTAWVAWDQIALTELLFRLRYADHPGVRKLVEHCEDALATRDEYTEDLEKEIGELERKIGELETALETELQEQAYREREQEDLEEKVRQLEEQLACEVSRTDDFWQENQKLVAEIERLEAEIERLEAVIKTEKEHTMSSEQIGKLAGWVAAVEKQQRRTNILLAEILAVLQNGGASAPPVAGSHGPEKEPAPEPEQDCTLDDVREAFIGARDRVGKKEALRIIREVAGDVKNITQVPEEKYGEIVVRLNDTGVGEAA